MVPRKVPLSIDTCVHSIGVRCVLIQIVIPADGTLTKKIATRVDKLFPFNKIATRARERSHVVLVVSRSGAEPSRCQPPKSAASD